MENKVLVTLQLPGDEGREISQEEKVFDEILAKGAYDRFAWYTSIVYKDQSSTNLLRFALGHSEGIRVVFLDDLRIFAPIGNDLPGKKFLEDRGVLRRHFVSEEIARKITDHFVSTGDRWPGIEWEPATTFPESDFREHPEDYYHETDEEEEEVAKRIVEHIKAYNAKSSASAPKAEPQSGSVDASSE